MNSLSNNMRVALAGIACIAALALAGCKKHEATAASAPAKPTGPPTIVVTTAPVSTHPIQRSVEAVGTFYGCEEVVVASKLTGRVKKVNSDMGDTVRPGDVLMELDDVDFRLAVEEATKSLESELAKLGMHDVAELDSDLSTLPAVVRAQLLTENAAQKVKRIEGLVRTNMATKEEYEQLLTDYHVAESDCKQALMDAQATRASARQKAALLDTARQKLADTRLIVPTCTINGKPAPLDQSYLIAERMVTEGEMVESTPATAMFRLVIDSPLKLRIEAPEREVSQIKVGQRVLIAVDAYPDRKFEGQVSRIRPAVDLASRTFDVEILVPNDHHELKTGNFAKASILTHEDPAAMTVPTESLVTFAGVTKVFVVENGKSRGVEVATGMAGNGWYEVAGPLTAGMRVVTSGYTQLADGTLVREREAAVETAAATAPDTTRPVARLSER